MTGPSPRRRFGFTLIELMVVVAVIAILSLMAVPSLRDRIVRQQVAEAIDSLDFARQAVAARFVGAGTFPVDNAAAGLPPADRIVGNLLSSVTVVDGALELQFGNAADAALRQRRLVLRPAHVPGYPQVPIAWLCAGARVPDRMAAQGVDRSDVPVRYLPLRCQPRGAPPP